MDIFGWILNTLEGNRCSFRDASQRPNKYVGWVRHLKQQFLFHDVHSRASSVHNYKHGSKHGSNSQSNDWWWICKQLTLERGDLHRLITSVDLNILTEPIFTTYLKSSTKFNVGTVRWNSKVCFWNLIGHLWLEPNFCLRRLSVKLQVPRDDHKKYHLVWFQY